MYCPQVKQRPVKNVKPNSPAALILSKEPQYVTNNKIKEHLLLIVLIITQVTDSIRWTLSQIITYVVLICIRIRNAAAVFA